MTPMLLHAKICLSGDSSFSTGDISKHPPLTPKKVKKKKKEGRTYIGLSDSTHSKIDFFVLSPVMSEYINDYSVSKRKDSSQVYFV